MIPDMAINAHESHAVKSSSPHTKRIIIKKKSEKINQKADQSAKIS